MSVSPNSGAGDGKPAVETFDELCNHMEHALGVKIPKYIKNILLYSGFNNRVTLRSLGESDMAALEIFGQSEAYHNLVKCKQGTMKDLYGNVYQFDYQHFAIPPGHRRLLMHMVACLQETQKPQKPKKLVGIPMKI